LKNDERPGAEFKLKVK